MKVKYYPWLCPGCGVGNCARNLRCSTCGYPKLIKMCKSEEVV